jgi:hypothetical protein
MRLNTINAGATCELHRSPGAEHARMECGPRFSALTAFAENHLLDLSRETARDRRCAPAQRNTERCSGFLERQLTHMMWSLSGTPSAPSIWHDEYAALAQSTRALARWMARGRPRCNV